MMLDNQNIVRNIDENIFLIDDLIGKYKELDDYLENMQSNMASAYIQVMQAGKTGMLMQEILWVYDCLIEKLNDLGFNGVLSDNKEQENVIEDSKNIRKIFCDWEEIYKEYKISASSGNLPNIELVIQWKLEVEVVIFEKYKNLEQLSAVLELERERREKLISQDWIDKPQVYPMNHAVSFENEEQDESDAEYIAEIYGSPQMMREAADNKQIEDVKRDVFCVYCGAKITTQTKVCPICGRGLQIMSDLECTAQFCIKCGRDIPIVSRFCPWCGNNTGLAGIGQTPPMGAVYASPEMMRNRNKRSSISKFFKRIKRT